MKKLFALFVGCIIGIGVVTSVEARENIVVVGSSTVYPFTTVVAEKHARPTQSAYDSIVNERDAYDSIVNDAYLVVVNAQL